MKSTGLTMLLCVIRIRSGCSAIQSGSDGGWTGPNAGFIEYPEQLGKRANLPFQKVWVKPGFDAKIICWIIALRPSGLIWELIHVICRFHGKFCWVVMCRSISMNPRGCLLEFFLINCSSKRTSTQWLRFSISRLTFRSTSGQQSRNLRYSEFFKSRK